MGDLRNKFRKQAEQEAIQVMQRTLVPPRAPEEPLRCHGCGLSTYEVAALYALPCERSEVQHFGCGECLQGIAGTTIPAGG